MGPWTEIVGIVKDSKYGSLREEILPCMTIAEARSTAQPPINTVSPSDMVQGEILAWRIF
jgi:hypothetical protein